jgi:hypothetical protein
MNLTLTLEPHGKQLMMATGLGLLLENDTAEIVEWMLTGQILTNAARELAPIANSPITKFEFAKGVGEDAFKRLREKYTQQISAKQIRLHVVQAFPMGQNQFRTTSFHTFT